MELETGILGGVFMPQAIGETIFDILYLGFALTTGLTMLIKGTQPLVKKAGLMAALS